MFWLIDLVLIFEPPVKGGFFYSKKLPIFATTSRRSFGARSKKWFNMLRV